MAQIAPFAAIHYDPDRVPLDQVIAPPYDVLSPAQQDALYARHPENIVRLMLNKEEPRGRRRRNNRYTRAAAFLQTSLATGRAGAGRRARTLRIHSALRASTRTRSRSSSAARCSSR